MNNRDTFSKVLLLGYSYANRLTKFTYVHVWVLNCVHEVVELQLKYLISLSLIFVDCSSSV